MNTITNIVGQRLRAYRLQQGMTQEELAEKADLHPTYIGQAERGEKNLTLLSLEKILIALNLSFSEFFEHYDSRLGQLDTAAKCYELINQKSSAEQNQLHSHRWCNRNDRQHRRLPGGGLG